MRNNRFEVFEIDGDVHAILNLEFFKVSFISRHGGVHWVLENLFITSVPEQSKLESE